MNRTQYPAAVLAAVSALALTACGGSQGGETASAESSAASTVEVEDNYGTQTVSAPPASVVATDNRTFETLADWGIELVAAPRALMPDTIAYADDESVTDLGNHREPDLEAVVAADPDLIVNGQRFADYRDDFADLVPDATIVELDPREDQPFDEELKRQTSALGEIFGRSAEAEEINGAFDAAMQRVVEEYQPGDTVMAVTVSGGEIGYIAPEVGRTLGPLFEIFDFAPALEVDGATDDHQGDDISVEAIADANPDWILVMDRDAAVSPDDAEYTPAQEVVENAEALRNVTAVREDNVVYMPKDTYTNEGIQTYTEFFNTLADAMGEQD
ncbi:iron ABC transporter substrate-binding protein [Kocuria sp. CNJ-770]|uniref:siderophore ABC transporter substrate-binding protein n=1 Tax=Kocuria sp. CNJ-770 TaxID=1904964 RepID=UPI00096759A6|nr:ABC transporter substrate-binding protein [Kocuria sp. CNJ-770]OLT08471.1 iron ABC transporter substrate-binding protein [Kocuria sp. CNJ-770]